MDYVRRYEQYAADLSRAQKGTEQEMALLNIMNFVEQLCLICNKKMAHPKIASDVQSLADDFLAGLNQTQDIHNVLGKFSTSRSSFEQIKLFYAKRRREIDRKTASLPQAVYPQSA